MGFRTDYFSENLRKIRVARRLTQRELGSQLGFSEKTVSKWECGAAIPNIETLFLICEVLQTNFETLFLGEECYFLGIDGGGTKTALRLVDGNGNVIRTHQVEGSNPVNIGLEAAKKILKAAIYDICKGIPFSSVTVFAGLAGGITGTMKQDIYAFLGEFGFAAFDNDSDNLNIIAAGLGERNGITVILGTGFCVYTQKDMQHKGIGGWGYLIDAAGSGFSLGRDALYAYFAAYDGSGKPTLLTEEIERIYSDGPEALCAHIYKNEKKVVAAFAPTVFVAIARGDEVAKEILERNISETARYISVAARIFDEDTVPVVLAGGLTKEPILIECLKKYLPNDKNYQLEILSCEPVQGAVMLAQKLGEMTVE